MGWIILALLVGCATGYAFCALLTAGKIEDMQNEIFRLIEKISLMEKMRFRKDD